VEQLPQAKIWLAFLPFKKIKLWPTLVIGYNWHSYTSWRKHSQTAFCVWANVRLGSANGEQSGLSLIFEKQTSPVCT